MSGSGLPGSRVNDPGPTRVPPPPPGEQVTGRGRTPDRSRERVRGGELRSTGSGAP